MTTAQLSFKSIPTLDISEGGTVPDLGLAGKGAWAWSNLLSKPVYWNGVFWTAGSAGSANSIQTTAVNVNPAAYRQHRFNAVNASVTATSKLTAWLSPNTDWEAEDLEDFKVLATANTGSIDFIITAPGVFVGSFDVSYMVGA